MSSFTSLGSTWNTTAGSKTVVVAPTLGDIIIIGCAVSTLTTMPTISDNNPGSVGAYIEIARALKNTSADIMGLFLRTRRITDVTSTTWTMTSAGDAGGGLFVGAIRGVNREPLNCLRQVATQANQAGATTPAPVLPAAPLTTSTLVAFIFDTTNGSANAVPPASWSEDIDQGFNVPASGMEVCHRDSGASSATLTFGGTTPSAYGALAAEFDGRDWDFHDPHMIDAVLMGTGRPSGRGM